MTWYFFLFLLHHWIVHVHQYTYIYYSLSYSLLIRIFHTRNLNFILQNCHEIQWTIYRYVQTFTTRQQIVIILILITPIRLYLLAVSYGIQFMGVSIFVSEFNYSLHLWLFQPHSTSHHQEKANEGKPGRLLGPTRK